MGVVEEAWLGYLGFGGDGGYALPHEGGCCEVAGLPLEVLSHPEANRFPNANSPVPSRKSMLYLLCNDILVEEEGRFLLELSKLLFDGLLLLDVGFDRFHEEEFEGRNEELHHQVAGHLDPLLAEVIAIFLLLVVEIGEDEFLGHATDEMGFLAVVEFVGSNVR